ncbi:MAG: hypothetical protein R3B40_14440 [Polyangiales bacterium]|nr:hypothetical protein [Sandaracinaceae bacterium]
MLVHGAASLDHPSLHGAILRRDERQPGWATIDLGPHAGARALREAQHRLARGLDREERRLRGRGLIPTALTFFDQGETTPFHVDGGPDESVLLLGYEPSARTSRLRVVDLPHAAAEAQSIAAYLASRPNGFPADDPRLSALAIDIPRDATHFVLVALCNSVMEPGHGWRGLLHQATVGGDPSAPRGVHTVHLRAAADAPWTEDAWRPYLEELAP